MGQPTTDNPQQVKTLQIITLGLMSGVVFFGVVAAFMASGNEPSKYSYFAWVALAFALVMTVVRGIIGNFLTKAFRNGIDRTVWDETKPEQQNSRLIGTMQTKHIVECGILEGAAIFNCIAYMFEKNILSLAVAAGLLIFMAVSFPSDSKVNHWVDNQKQLINLGT